MSDSDLPDESLWVTAAALSKRVGKGAKTIVNYRKKGLFNESRNKRVRLKMWKTMRGYVTTQAEIQRFHRELNT